MKTKLGQGKKKSAQKEHRRRLYVVFVHKLNCANDSGSTATHKPNKTKKLQRKQYQKNISRSNWLVATHDSPIDAWIILQWIHRMHLWISERECTLITLTLAPTRPCQMHIGTVSAASSAHRTNPSVPVSINKYKMHQFALSIRTRYAFWSSMKCPRSKCFFFPDNNEWKIEKKSVRNAQTDLRFFHVRSSHERLHLLDLKLFFFFVKFFCSSRLLLSRFVVAAEFCVCLSRSHA